MINREYLKGHILFSSLLMTLFLFLIKVQMNKKNYFAISCKYWIYYFSGTFFYPFSSFFSLNQSKFLYLFFLQVFIFVIKDFIIFIIFIGLDCSINFNQLSYFQICIPSIHFIIHSNSCKLDLQILFHFKCKYLYFTNDKLNKNCKTYLFINKISNL